jgi:DsbC/DsbD-like thiol-disulfide interchange protein
MTTEISAGMSWRVAALVAACMLGGAQAAAAEAYASEWAKGLKSSARLISAGGALAGIEIQLAPGTITYWRNPGDAGLPPVFSFEGSSNLARAEVQFPAPTRILEGDGEAFGYDRSLILPIDVRASDPTKPVTLALKINYAVCEKICVPAEANLGLLLPAAVDSPFAQAILAARSQVPRAIDWPGLRADIVAQGENRWRLCIPAEAGRARDAFIEAPERWWIAMSAQFDAIGPTACFAIELKQKPEGASLPVTVRVTITGGQGPIETSMILAR